MSVHISFDGKVFDVPFAVLGLSEHPTQAEVNQAVQNFLSNPPKDFPDSFPESSLSQAWESSLSSPPKFKRSQFRVLMENISGENPNPRDPLAAWYIQFFGENDIVRFVGIEPKLGVLQFRKSFDEVLRFLSMEQAERRLNQAIESGEFEISFED